MLTPLRRSQGKLHVSPSPLTTQPSAPLHHLPCPALHHRRGAPHCAQLSLLHGHRPLCSSACGSSRPQIGGLGCARSSLCSRKDSVGAEVMGRGAAACPRCCCQDLALVPGQADALPVGKSSRLAKEVALPRWCANFTPGKWH